MATGVRATATVGPEFPVQGVGDQVERALRNRMEASRAQPVTREMVPYFPGYTLRLQRWASPIQRRGHQLSNVANAPLQLSRGIPLPGARASSTSSGKVVIGNSLWTTAATRLPWLPA